MENRRKQSAHFFGERSIFLIKPSRPSFSIAKLSHTLAEDIPGYIVAENEPDIFSLIGLPQFDRFGQISFLKTASTFNAISYQSCRSLLTPLPPPPPPPPPSAMG